MAKEESLEVKKEKVTLGPTNPFWRTLFNLLLVVITSLSLFVWALFYIHTFFKDETTRNKLLSLTSIITIETRMLIIYIIVAILIIMFVLFFLKLKAPAFDYWVRDIANKRLQCTHIFFDKKYLYFEYDVGLKTKDIKEFITEISDKSRTYTYYLQEVDIDRYVAIVLVRKRQVIPKRCTINKEKDTLWNVIPLGEAVNNELCQVTPIGWYLNDNNVNKEMVHTEASTSLVIAGGTGSGKSVVENGIIGHITRHSDKIQGLLCDVKRVEFGGLESYKGIHKVGLTIEEVESILKQSRQIMMDRFEFMEHNGVNNVYKLKNQVDYFTINGKTYQFDEIMSCEIDGIKQLLTLDKIYEAVEEGKNVEINDLALI